MTVSHLFGQSAWELSQTSASVCIFVTIATVRNVRQNSVVTEANFSLRVAVHLEMSAGGRQSPLKNKTEMHGAIQFEMTEPKQVDVFVLSR